MKNGNTEAKRELTARSVFRFHIPGIGFGFLSVSLILTIIGFVWTYKTYSIDNFTINRRVVLMTVLSIWFMAFMLMKTPFMGNAPIWSGVICAATAFMQLYALLLFIQPCISAIGYVFGASDLIMGDVEKNRAVANGTIITAVLYVIAAICTVAAAFCSDKWITKEERRNEKERIISEKGKKKERKKQSHALRAEEDPRKLDEVRTEGEVHHE